MRKAKNFTSSPFSFYIKVLSFQGWIESINAYAAFLTEFLKPSGSQDGQLPNACFSNFINPSPPLYMLIQAFQFWVSISG